MMAPSIQKVDLFTLSPEARTSFEALLPGNPHDIFNPNASDSHRVIAFAAFDNEKPVGQICCFTYPDIREAFLVSVDFQNQENGLALMQRLLEELTTMNIGMVTFSYLASLPSTPFLNKILKSTGWADPKLLTRRYFLDQHSFQPEWFFSSFPKLADRFSLFPWVDAKPHELELAKEWEIANPSMTQYSPFDNQYPIDAKTSLGLRDQDHLAGWLVNHQINPKLLRYSAFYLSPEIRGQSAAICMLRESIRLHLKEDRDKVGMIEINFKLSPSSWIRFVK